MQFFPDNFYHIYNRGNDKQMIFMQERNYDYFLNKIEVEIQPLCSIIAYCLMPNHYHLLVYISDKDRALNLIQNQQLHQNPLHAKLVVKMEEWKYSSFNAYYTNNERICNLKLARELIDIPKDSEKFYKESYAMIQDGDVVKII